MQVAAAELRTRAASILAAKFMLTDKPHPVDALLAAALPAFLSHLSDSEWHGPCCRCCCCRRRTSDNEC